MIKAGLIRKAVVAGALLGALTGLAEAACVARFSDLYFTAAGRAGLMLFAVASYAVFGAAAAAVVSGAFFFFHPERRARAGISAAALPVALLYSVAILLSFGVLSRANLFSARMLLWVTGLVAASIIVAYLSGLVGEALLRCKKLSILVVLCVAIALGAWPFLPRGKGARPGGEIPDVVLVTIDTTRADRLHCYGHDRIETPTMDKLASEGVLFENAIAQIPITNPSHLSILSSRYPHQMGVTDNWYRRPPGITTIVDEFKGRGYETAAFVSAFALDSRFGFAEGFDIYDDDQSRVKGFQGLALVRIVDTLLKGAGLPQAVGELRPERDARQTNKEVFSWLERRADSPFFLWVHYYDPHGPYMPPAPYSGMYYSGVKDDPANRSMEGIRLPRYWPPGAVDFTDIDYPVAQYDAEITYLDTELERLFEELDRISDDYILVVVGDHGESLTEHGLLFRHGRGLYEEQIRVPLIISSKGRVQPARVSSVVENLDIAPTILEMAGLDIPDGFEGESLLPLMRGERPDGEPGALSETGWRGTGVSDGGLDIAYRTDRYKLIIKPDEGLELYDIVQDPRELHDISAERRDLVKAYEEKIRSILSSQVQEASTVMDYETEEKLRSLGYIR